MDDGAAAPGGAAVVPAVPLGTLLRGVLALLLGCLVLALPTGTAGAQTAFGVADLAGTWQVHILLGSNADVPGSTLDGLVSFDSSGAVVSGTLTPAGGAPSPLAGGQVAVAADGIVTGTLTSGSGDTQRTAQVVEGRMLLDRAIVVGVLLGGDLLDVAGADFGLITLVKQLPGSGTTDDLTGSWRYHELRTPAAAGLPAVSVVGDVVFNPALPGMITGGALALSDATIETPTGVAAIAPDGSLAADLTGLVSSWTLDGQIVATRDLVAGGTVVGPGAAFGLAVLSRVATDVSFGTADLAGAWRLYALTLDAAEGNLGSFRRGALVVDDAGVLTSGGLIDPDGVETALTSSTLSVEPVGGRVTGMLAGSGATLELDGTLRGPRDLLTAVGTLTIGTSVSRVLVAMVPAVSLISFNASTYTVLEGSPAQVTLLRTGDTTPTTILGLRAQSPRFGNQSFEIVFESGADRVTFPIPTVDDAVSGAETVALSLENLPAHVVSGPPASLTIGDNEQAGTIRFTAATASVNEGASLSLSVARLGTRLGGGVTVAWEVVGGTATPGDDFDLPLTGTLTFGPGITVVPLVVPTIGDALAEGPETIVLRLRDPSSGAVLGTPIQVTVTINDNDVAGSVQFAAVPPKVFENAGSALVTVTRMGGAAGAVTVEYETSDLSARDGVDYTRAAGTLTFDAGVMTRTINVSLLDNALADGDRTVRLTLRNPGGRATLGALREQMLTILDDEVGLRFSAAGYSVAENGGGATITVVRTGPAVGVASVSYSTGDGTAQAGVDYTPASGRLVFQPAERSKTFRVPVLEDGLVEGPETVLLLLSNPEGTLLGSANTSVLTIIDNDLGGAIQMGAAALTVSEGLPSGMITVAVTRTGGLAGAVTVDYATSDGSALGGQDYAETTGTLTFAAGERSKSILVPLLSDRLVEGPETFQVTLSNPAGGATLGAPVTTVVTIADEDTGGVIKLGAATLRVAEPEASPTVLATITVLRTGSNLASGVSVQYATADVTAIAGMDYVAAAGQLVFGPGETTKTFQVTVNGDGFEQEVDETFTITLSDPQGGATLGSPATLTATIVNSLANVQFERLEYAVEERAGTASLALLRSGPSTGTVTVRYATADIAEGDPPASHALAGLDYRAASGVVTFRPGESRKTITVPILFNPLLDNNKAFQVVLSEPVGLILGVNNPSLVTILDSARPAVLGFASAASVVREGTAAAPIVTRTGGLDGVVAVNWTATGITATAGADFPIASTGGTLTFTAGVASRVISIPTVNDTLAEGDETLTVQITGVNTITGTTASPGPQVTHTVTIQDNDVAGTIELSADAYTVQEGGSAGIVIRRTGGAASGVTVRYTTEDLPSGSGAAVAGVDYTGATNVVTFNAGETTKTVPIPTLVDAFVEPDEAFRVTLSDPQPAGLATLGARTLATVTIVDRQPRLAFRDAVVRATEGQPVTVTVTRTGSLVGTVTVAYGAGPGTAVEGTDYAPFGSILTFGPNVTTRSFTVTTLPNGAVDGVRTLELQLTGPDGASLGRAVAELRIEDDERAGTVQFAQGAYSVVEGGTGELAIARTAGSSGEIGVQYEVTGASTATGGGTDYTLAAGTVVLAAGQASATLAVPTVADGLPEGTETVVVRLTGVSGGGGLGALTTATLFIIDREQTLAFGAPAFTVGETESQAGVTVVRGGLPTGALEVAVRTQGGTATPGLDYQPVSTTLSFAAGEILKTVAVPIPDGAAARSGNRTVGLVLEGEPGVVGTPATTELTILDFRPDLMVVAVSTPAAALSGKILNTPMSVRNGGRVMAPPFQVGVFLARNDIPGATLPGAGTLLALESIPTLMPGVAVQLTTLLSLADDLASGTYYVSAVADFGQAVGEVDEGNNGLGSAPRTIQISKGLTKLTSASATLAQGDPVLASASGARRFAPDVTDGCDAPGAISLTGSFQITSQIGSLAQATARLTGTLMDQPVQYEFALELTIGDDDSVTAPFQITSISGAFSGSGAGTFTGSLVGSALEGGITGTINTSTPRVCAFTGTLRAAGDVSFAFNLEQRARGGVFGTAATPGLELPAAVDEYQAAFRVLFDTDFPAPVVVAFTGPAGSAVSGAPASGRRSELDADGAAATYRLPPVARDGGGPGGAWSVLYKGAPRAFTVPEPVADRRLVLAIPTVVVDGAGLLTAVNWTWADRNGVAMDPPPFVGLVRVRLMPNVGVSPLLESPPLARGNTSYALPLAVLWEDVAELAMIYQDTVTGHEYRVAYPRMHRAFAELETVHAVDKTGPRDAQVFSASFIAPVGTVDPGAVGAVRVSGAGLVSEPVPYQGRMMQGDQQVDLFRLRRDVDGAAPAMGTPVTFTITPLAGPVQVLATSLRNQGTNQSIQITSPTGTTEADAMLGVRRQIAWTLPPPAVLGGFDVDTVRLSGIVRTANDLDVCAADADQELGPDATLGFITLPATCAGLPADSSTVCVVVLGTGGEQARACHTFGPDDMLIEFTKAYFVTEGQTATVAVRRRGPTRRAATVVYATVGGTAIPDVDYTPASGPLVFPPGSLEQTFTVITLNDTLAGIRREVLLRLSDPSPGVVLRLNNRPLLIEDDDQAGTIQFAQAAYGVTEGGTAALTVTRTGTNLASGVTIDYQIVGGSAVNGTDYTLANGTLSFAAGQTAHSIPVPTANDTTAQGPRTVLVRFANPLPSPLTRVGTPFEATLTIGDDEQGGVIQFRQTGLKLTETVTPLSLEVVRTGVNLGGNVTVDYRVATSGTTAVSGLDFTLAAGTLAFAAGQASRTIPVSLLDDAAADRAKTLVVELLNPRGGNASLGGASRATISIADNEQEIQFSVSSLEIDEGRSKTLTIERTGPLTGTATVTVATVNGSAVGAPLLPVPPPNTADYVSISGPITFRPNERSRTITIVTRQDTVPEGDHTFFVVLSAPSPGVVIGPRSVVTVTIVDDEQTVRFQSSGTTIGEGGTATITVERKGPSNTTTAVDYALTDGTGVNGVDYTNPVPGGVRTLIFAPGVVSRTFTVTTLNNTRDDGTRTAGLTLSNARTILPSLPGPIVITRSASTLFITDEEQGGTIQFAAATATAGENQPFVGLPPQRRRVPLNVSRTGTSLASNVRVDYRVIGGTAPAGDYSLPNGTLTFGTGVTTLPIEVSLVDNALADRDRTLIVELTNAYGGGVLGSIRQTTLTIVDDEQEIQFSSTGYSQLEGLTATITVTRTGPITGTATVAYATGGGTATPATDYQPVSSTLTFAPGVTIRTFTVPTFQNTIDDTVLQTVGLTLSAPSAGVVLGPRQTSTLFISDEDQGGAIRFESGAAAATEGGIATLTVLRSGTNLASNVTVSYQVVGGTAVNGTHYTLAPGTLSFAAGQASQTIQVPTINNTLADGTRTVLVRLGSATGGAILQSPTEVTLSIADDDQGGTIQFEQSGVSSSEFRFTLPGLPPNPVLLRVVRAGTNLASGVSVPFRVAGGTAAAGVDYTLANGTLTFAANQSVATIPVTLINNQAADGDRTLLVDLVDPPQGGAVLGTTRRITLTIVDDEQQLQFSSSGYSLIEGGTATITVTRTGPTTSQVTVDYATIPGGTAVAGTDYTSVSGRLTFAPGVTSQTFTVPTIDDAVYEGNRTVVLQLSNPSFGGFSGVLLGPRSQATLTIVENERQVRFSATTYTVSESTPLAILTVVIDGPASSSTLNVSYTRVGGTATPGSDIQSSTLSGTVSFGPFMTSRQILLQPINDLNCEGTETVILRLSNPTPGLLLGSPSQATLNITNAFCFPF